MFFYDLERIVKKKIINYSYPELVQNIKILIAYSGGVDSSVLLEVVNSLSIKMGFQYDFVYINHNMNPNFHCILNFANNFSEKNNCNFIYHKIQNSPKKNKESFYRNYRYVYFDDLAKKNKYNFIFTGHHYDDQVETLYMRTQGRYDWTRLQGVRESKGLIRRPFLKVKKRSLFNYAIKKGVCWVFDVTNNDNNILRNNVRNKLLPNRNIFSHWRLLFLNKYSKINFLLFKSRFNKIKDKIIISNNGFILLNKKCFLKLNLKYRKLFFQSILKKYNNDYLMNKASKWSALWRYLDKDKNLRDFILDKNIFVNNSKNLIIIKNKKEYIKKINLTNEAIWEDCVFKLESVSDLNMQKVDKDKFYVHTDLFAKGLFIRNWSQGDSYIDSNNNKKRVSKLFLKNKFNNYEKMIYPIVVDANDVIVWIPGLVNNVNNINIVGNNNCIKISKEILN